MRRQLARGYELDDDPARIDLAEVTRFLSQESYWARERSREAVARSIRAAARVVCVDRAEEQIGFARVVSDDVAFAYLADVYVGAAHRGQGLGTELVREAVERGPQRRLLWLLHTADAHGLYAKLGFRPPSERVLERTP